MEQTLVKLTGYHTSDPLFLAPEKILSIQRRPKCETYPEGTFLEERTEITGKNTHEVWLVIETPEEVHAAIAKATGGQR